jgi:hypothetical protein
LDTAEYQFSEVCSFLLKSLLFLKEVRVEGLEPPYLTAVDPKSTASTNFATPAFEGAKLQSFLRVTNFFLIILKNIFCRLIS